MQFYHTFYHTINIAKIFWQTLAKKRNIAILILSYNISLKTAFAKDIDDAFFEDDTQIQEAPSFVKKTEVKDPLEKINRLTFSVYQKLDLYALDPLITLYLKTPQLVQNGISNSSSNLGEPITIVNAILARRLDDVSLSFSRFFLNSLFGFAGFEDIASKAGIIQSDIEFADVLRGFGIPDGPYFVSPFGGTSGNLIDSISFAQGIFLSPYRYGGHQLQTTNVSRVAGSVISIRAKYDDIIDNARINSVDMYLTQKNFFIASRKARRDRIEIVLQQKTQKRNKQGTTIARQMYNTKLNKYLL